MSYTASYIVNSNSAQGTTDFTFTFPYIKEEHIEVYLNYNKISQGTGSNQYQVITNVSPKLIRLNTGIASANLRVEVRRNSSLGSPLVDYADGSTLTANDLDTSALQSLYIDQELKDNQGKTVSVDEDTGLPSMGESSAGNLRLTKVADPTAAQDAATKNYVDTTAEPKSAKLTELATMAQNTANALADLTEAEVQAIDGLTASTDELNILDGVTATKDEINILDGVTATKDELNILDGVTATKDEINILDGVTATKDELNILDGVTATKDELNILDGVTATKDEINILDGVTATKDELNILDGVTATKDEINILDGVTATKDEINKLDGVTASTTEINKLDGLTATTTELNKLDGVTATTDELNKTDGLLATPTELNTLDGITSNTSELNKLDGVTASTAELNIVAGKTFKDSTGTLNTTSDTEIPSSKVIAAHVASSQTAIGGFVTIADEVSFPNTQPANGVVVSINNAAGVVINGSGVSTSGKRVDNTTVTINGFPSSLNGETLAAGVGLIVVSTSTANTYSYHKILSSETDVKQLSDDINDFNSRYRIAGSAPGSNNDAGDLYFDTAANKMKVYNGTTNAWDDVASVGNFYINTISSSSSTGGGSATFNGSAYRFTLSNPPTMAQQLIVSVNGVIQKPNSGTSQPSEGFAISGNDIIFSAAPASGSDYFIVTQGSSVSIGTPSDNTVTSAKIVDGSIVNGDISSSANIAGSKIADDSIPEVKLDVHNAPATDKYLKYTSNGMEWSDGASEGTDVKSTGESGTAKFLRVDGDGTCSWQVPPDTNTQLTLKDEDNFASNSDTAAASQQSIKAYVDTQVGSISAAPTITGTMTGSVSAEGPIAVKSDGTLEPISSSISINSTPTTTVEHQVSRQANDNNYNSVTNFSCFYHPVNNKYIINWSSSNNVETLYRIGTPSTDGKTVTWGTASASVGKGWEAYDAFFDTNSNKILHVGKTNENKWQYRVQDYTTVGSLTDITSSRNPVDSVACQAGNKLISFVRVGNYGYARVGTMGATTGVTWGSEYTICNSLNSLRDLCIAYDTTHSRLLFGYTYYAGSSYFGALKVATVSQTANDNTMTVGSETNMVTSTTFCAETSICHNPSDEKMYIVFRDQSSGLSENGRLTGTVGTIADSGNSITMSGSKTAAASGDVQKSSMRTKLIYNPNITRVCLFWTDVAGVTNTSKAGTITSDGSNVFSFESSFTTSLIGKETDPYTGQHMFGVDYNSTAKIIIGVVPNDESSKSLSFFASDHGGPVSNSNKFIGYADAGYTNGQTATVKVVGNTTTQSSLTPGTTYYIQNNGTLGTTAELYDVKAGIALSSTKLLIKG